MKKKDFTKFEWEVAQIGWSWCDVDAMIEDEDENGTVTAIIKHEAAKLLQLAKKELQPEQLPDNLDKAAEDFVWEVMENDEDGISELSKKLFPSSKISDYYDALAEFFKAGAKWMAEQGNSIQCEIDWHDGPYPDFTEEQQVELCKGFKPGEKVIVQIRKAE